MAARAPPHTRSSSPRLILLGLILNTFLILVCAGHLDQQIRYDGHKVFRILPKTEEHRTLLKEYLHRTPEADVWKEGTSLGEPVDIQVPPHHVTSFINHFQTHNIPHDTFIEDVQEGIERSRRSVPDTMFYPQDYKFDKYLNYTDIMEWLIYKNDQCGSMCSLIPIGNSTQNRTLVLIKIGRPGFNKRKLWIDAGIHAREWISPATAMYFIDQLISGYWSNSMIQSMVDDFDWYILPLINPDGYHYTHTDDRLWRKTRSLDPETGCYGVDANRNFDYKWRTIGASSNPCKITFAGKAPYSEPEAKAVADFIKGPLYLPTLYLTLHSYGQLWMPPWGYTRNLTKTHNRLVRSWDISRQMC